VLAWLPFSGPDERPAELRFSFLLIEERICQCGPPLGIPVRL